MIKNQLHHDNDVVAALFLKCKFRGEKKHTKYSSARELEELQRKTTNALFRRLSSLPVWTHSPKNVLTESNDSCICFLRTECNPLHCSSVFYAWVTAGKQCLLVLLTHSTPRSENRSDWAETKSKFLWRGVHRGWLVGVRYGWNSSIHPLTLSEAKRSRSPLHV